MGGRGGEILRDGISLVIWLITTAAAWPVLSLSAEAALPAMTPPRGARVVGADIAMCMRRGKEGRKYGSGRSVGGCAPVLCHR